MCAISAVNVGPLRSQLNSLKSNKVNLSGEYSPEHVVLYSWKVYHIILLKCDDYHYIFWCEIKMDVFLSSGQMHDLAIFRYTICRSLTSISPSNLNVTKEITCLPNVFIMRSRILHVLWIVYLIIQLIWWWGGVT